MTQIKPNLLFSPGPTMISPKTLQVLSEPTIHHRTKEFEADFKEVLQLLKFLYQTPDHVFCLTSTGTGAMEATLINLLEPGQKALFFNGGKFGERWGKMSKSFGIETKEIKQNWGEAFDLKNLETELKNQKYDAFLLQACETSTATCYPIAEIAALVKKIQPECLLIVDGITAVGAYDLPMHQLAIDALVSGSQKALGLPTGLAFVGLSARALEVMKQNKNPKFYFDLKPEYKANLKDTTNFSTPVAQIMALKFKLNFIKSVGLKNYFAKNIALQESTIRFLKALNCNLLSESPSPSLTAFFLPDPKVSADDLQKQLLADGLYLAGGQDDYKGKILRWGHMGDISVEDQILAYKIFAKRIADISPIKVDAETLINEESQILQKTNLINKCLP